MISIITPTYNRADLISETIRSVLAQSYSDFEWIIVDDGSEDETEIIVKGFNDLRIKYFILPHSARLPFIRNYGVKKAKGDYIALMDSDDLWKNNFLSEWLCCTDRLTSECE